MPMLPGFRLAVLASGLACAIAPASAEVFRCRMPDGTTSYRDQPCPGEATESAQVEPSGQDAARRGMGAWVCRTPKVDALTQVPQAEIESTLASLPDKQRHSVTAALQGVALGSCHLHGGGCDGSLRFYREQDLIVICTSSEHGPRVETHIPDDGKIYIRRDGSFHVKVLDPHADAAGPDAAYRVDLSGARVPGS